MKICCVWFSLVMCLLIESMCGNLEFWSIRLLQLKMQKRWQDGENKKEKEGKWHRIQVTRVSASPLIVSELEERRHRIKSYVVRLHGLKSQNESSKGYIFFIHSYKWWYIIIELIFIIGITNTTITILNFEFWIDCFNTTISPNNQFID